LACRREQLYRLPTHPSPAVMRVSKKTVTSSSSPISTVATGPSSTIFRSKSVNFSMAIESASASRSSSSYLKTRTNRRAPARFVLMTVSTTINAIRALEELQERLLDLIFEVVPARHGAILLSGEQTDPQQGF